MRRDVAADVECTNGLVVSIFILFAKQVIAMYCANRDFCILSLCFLMPFEWSFQ